MEWDKLLTKGKEVPEPYLESKSWEKYQINEFEKDYKKIIASVSFRRLQDKTQVFPLDKSDFVRTRLTHSIEASMIAKQLGVMVYKGYSDWINDPKNKGKTSTGTPPMTPENAQEICDVLTCAGLLHDLGNPPFGHFGETVIGEWFQNHFKEEASTWSQLPAQCRLDLQHFEGNAQCFRMLTKCSRAQPDSKFNGNLNLTYAVIQTLMKYPTDSEHFSDKDPDVKKHKNGYLFAGKEHLEKIAKKTETFINGEIVRHPLTFLLEAADDIAYATADIEDALKKGLFTLAEFAGFYKEEVEKIGGEYLKSYKEEAKVIEDQKGYSVKLIEFLSTLLGNAKTVEDDLNAFNVWVRYAREWLMYCAAYGFIHNYHAIMEGKFSDELLTGTFHGITIQVLKEAMKHFVYETNDILKLELSAQTIISFLLDRFVPAALHCDMTIDQNGNIEVFKNDSATGADKKCMNLIPDNYKNDYLNDKKPDDANYNLYLRLLMVCDYISGMTDSFAKNLYQELHGII